ncbi:hypothetical protein [Streptomyces sp. TLI_171]|uniref:hypothetical protein n=1 Tax=Streptomyces sp. TLI_171 TaxID=1938859 RepID=UPI000C19A0E9|nr:hypothetical protein [Streptomyces sp. TLI_171]RKE18669.1 hypothetical protein BX266_1962 [Streptomyces sp. TLI_171]
MGIGYLLLHGALALVALWLAAELLLQNRAALRWRALALAGFLAVVAGMSQSSVPVIGAGAAAFALGQAMVTMSVKRGRPVGWSLRRADGSLPGPLAKVPLLSAATGGAAVAAVETVAPVGEVGPVEDEAPDEQPYAYEEFQELDAGVYTEDQAAYQQQYYYQQQAAGYQQQQQWTPQPLLIGYDQYGQPVYQYQDPYAQQQYQDPSGASGWGDPHAQQQYQAQYQQQPYIPQQPGPEPDQQQNWYYQQQY